MRKFPFNSVESCHNVQMSCFHFQWDLVCSKKNFIELSIVVHVLGSLCGTFLCSPLGDKFGRKKPFFIAQAVLCLFGIASAFSPNFETFCVLCFVRGIMQGVSIVFVFVIGLFSI